METGVQQVPLSAPSDVSERERFIEAGVDPAIVVSGGAEHQCVERAASIIAVVRV